MTHVERTVGGGNCAIEINMGARLLETFSGLDYPVRDGDIVNINGTDCLVISFFIPTSSEDVEIYHEIPYVVPLWTVEIFHTTNPIDYKKFSFMYLGDSNVFLEHRYRQWKRWQYE